MFYSRMQCHGALPVSNITLCYMDESAECGNKLTTDGVTMVNEPAGHCATWMDAMAVQTL